MNRFFFKIEEYNFLYNCSGRSLEEWKAIGKPNAFVGLTYIGLGLVFEVMYIPFLIVIYKSNLLQYSCYKIMFFLGLIDTTVILINAITFGYLSLIGAIFCTSPTFIYLIGCISLGQWCGACCTCMLLAFNRCLDMLKPELGRAIFSGRKTFYLLSIPTLYALYYIWFTNPLIYNSIYYASLFDPFVGSPEKGYSVDSEKYPHTEHTVNNLIVMATLVIFYTSLCITLSLKSRGISNTVKMSKMQKQMILQSSIICFFNLTAASIYVYMQFFPTPIWTIVIGQLAWQGSHGAAGFIYMFLNPTLRHSAIQIYLKPFIHPKSPAAILPTITTANLTENKRESKNDNL